MSAQIIDLAPRRAGRQETRQQLRWRDTALPEPAAVLAANAQELEAHERVHRDLEVALARLRRMIQAD